MADVKLGDYKNLYLETAGDYVEKISGCLNQLSHSLSNNEALNNLHINSHSLKSQSQVMGFSTVAQMCLDLEQISDDCLKGETNLDQVLITSLKDTVEKIKSEIVMVEKA